MDNLNKKQETKFIILFAIFSITILTILTILCVFCKKNNLKNKTKAYTNDVVSYANEQVTDLTGTSWRINDNIESWTETHTYNIYFESNNENFVSLMQYYRFSFGSDGEPLFYTELIYDSLVIYQQGYLIEPNYQIINITGGNDSTNSDLIYWLYQNAVLQAPLVQEYTISSNLINTNSNISLPLTITENDTISFEFTPTENNIFNTYQWTITPLHSYSLDNLVEEPFKISFDISNVTSDLTINIEAIPYISLKGQWVLKDFNQMTITASEILRNVNFSSNGYSYNNISALGGDYLRYYSDDLVVNVLSLLDNGLTSSPLAYLPTSTYNYNLITIDSDYYYGIYTTEYNLPSYLKNITYFTEIFRPATQNDIDNINFKNGQISILQNEYTFVGMFGALIDAPITALKGLLNFTFFGVNLFSFLTLFITLAVVYLCIKMLKGGRKDE